MIPDFAMDNMLNDVVDIFTNVEGVKYVRLKGLAARATRLANTNIEQDFMDIILNKMRRQGIIRWFYEFKCPFCGEVFYQIEDTPIDQLRICDTCQSFVIPKDNLYICPPEVL